MNADKVLRYLDQQQKAIQALIDQLDEVQVAFNAQFDDFKARHDDNLDQLTDRIAGHLEAISPELRAAIDERLPEERRQIEERRQKVREQYLPQRRQAADDLLADAQAELERLRALNPKLDKREERLKRKRAKLEARLAELNEEIRVKSRGLGVVRHFLAITQADRERQQIIGKLEANNESLHEVRREWESKRQEVEEHQADYQERWQLESMAVARLQAELDGLDDEVRREDLALHRAVRHVLDEIKEPLPSADPEIDAGLRDMVQLNIQTDAYHEGLASVGGLIGLAGGVRSGLEAVGQSVDGLRREQRMHSDYLKALSFSLPDRVEDFHEQWPALAKQFTDEEVIGAHPAQFTAAVEPLLEGPLSQASIEAMFGDLAGMIKQATAQW